MSGSRNLGVGLAAVLAVGVAFWLLLPGPTEPVATAPVEAPPEVATPPAPEAEVEAPGEEEAEAPAAEGAAPEAAAAVAPVYDDAEARRGPFDLDEAGAQELMNAHAQRVDACRRVLAGKARRPIPVTLTVRAATEGPGYVAVVEVPEGAEGVNAAFGPCLQDAFAEARFEPPYGDKQIKASVP